MPKDHQYQGSLMLDFVVAPDKESGLIWIERKHASGLEGAGTEPWKPMAKERADAERGKSTPNLDVVNFVLTNPELDSGVRNTLQGSKFNLTTLERILTDSNTKKTIDISIKNGQIVTTQDKDRVMGLLTEIVTIIATRKYNGEKFTERLIDNEKERGDFIKNIASHHPKPKKSNQSWIISGISDQIMPNSKPSNPNKVKSTQSTEERPTLIPGSFKLRLPHGKINDIFKELKTLNVNQYRHAVSILFRVFIELSLDHYLEKCESKLSEKKEEFLINKFKKAIKHVENSTLMTDAQLKPIRVELNDKDSFMSPHTWNSYVHNPDMNPDPMQLKTTWNNMRVFIEKLWQS